eukprot:jgi/Mesvir1/10607/Mv08936-RA.1
MASAAPVVECVLGYGAGALTFVDNSTILSVCGNSLCLHNIATGEDRFLWGPEFGISPVFAVHKKKGLVAYATKGIKPVVYIHNCSTLKLVARAQGATEVEFAAMAFSRDGTQLATLGSSPDQRLVVWDLTRGEQAVKLAEANAGVQCKFLSFNPWNPEQLVTSGYGKLLFWATDSGHDKSTLTATAATVSEPFEPHCHAWCPDGGIYIGCTGGQFLLLDPNTRQPMTCSGGPETAASKGRLFGVMQGNQTVECMTVTREYLVTSGRAGTLQWWKHPVRLNAFAFEKNVVAAAPEGEDPDAAKMGALKLALSHQFEGLSCAVCALDYSTSFAIMVVGLADGRIYSLELHRERSSDPPPQSPRSAAQGAALAPVTVRSSLLSDYHVGPITGVGVLEGGEMVVTCGADGSVRCWHAGTRKLLCKRSFVSPQTCLTVSRQDAVVVGGATGVVRALHPSKEGDLKVIYRQRLHQGSVLQLSFDGEGRFLATVGADGRAFVLRTDLGVFKVLCFLGLPEPARDITWLARGYASDRVATVLAILRSGRFIKLEPMLAPAEDAPLEVTTESSYMEELEMKRPLLCMAAFHPPARNEAEMEIPLCYMVCMGAHRHLALYKLPEASQAWVLQEDPVYEAEVEIPAHEKQGTCVALSNTMDLVASAGSDGGLQLWTMQQLMTARMASAPGVFTVHKPVAALGLHDAFAGGVLRAAFGNGFLATAGADGMLFLVRVHGAVWAPLERYEAEKLQKTRKMLASRADQDGLDGDAELAVPELERINQEARKEALKQSANSAVHERMAKLRVKLARLVASNDRVPEIEKIPASAFIIDTAYQRDLEEEGMRQVELTQKQVWVADLRTELLLARIKHTCWDVHQTNGSFLKGLASSRKVCNFPLMLEDTRKAGQFKMVTYLRRVEMAERAALLADVPEDDACVIPVAHTPGKRGRNVTAATGDDDEHASTEHEHSNEWRITVDPSAPNNKMDPLEELLYAWTELYCPLRQRIQMWLLQQILAAMRARFNTRFDALYAKKQAAHENVRGLAERAREIIAKELKSNEVVAEPHIHPHEDVRNLLVVRPDEMTVEKFVSPEEQRRQQEKERQEEERRLVSQKDDRYAGALVAMMGGKLEAAAESELWAALPPKPAWMLGDRDAMTEDQLREIKEFEAAQKAVEDERDKRRKQLETELRRVKDDMAAACAQFDQALDALYEDRLTLEAKERELELMVVLLGWHVAQEESLMLHEKNLEAELVVYKTKKVANAQAVNELRQKLEQARGSHDALIAQDRSLDKAFKRDFMDVEDYVEELYALFKKRTRIAQGGAGGAVPPSGPKLQRIATGGRANKALQPLQHQVSIRELPQAYPSSIRDADPFADESDSKLAKLLEPLTIYDKPEGLDILVWERFLEARDTKLAVEDRLATSAAAIGEMSRHLAWQSAEEEANQTHLEKLMSEVNALRRDRWRRRFNVVYPIRIKQAHVEVPLPGATDVPDDGVLLRLSVVMDANDVIHKHGAQKLELMGAIKDFKKGIYECEWLNKKLAMDEKDAQERFRELQLLRVTKNLQTIIKDGDDTTGTALEISNMEKRIVHNKKLHAKHIADMQAELARLEARARKQAMQNQQLAAAVDGMGVALKEQASLRDRQELHMTVMQKEQDTRMRRLVTKRQLSEIAGAQQQELLTLRAELDRMTRKSIPVVPEDLPNHILPDGEPYSPPFKASFTARRMSLAPVGRATDSPLSPSPVQGQPRTPAGADGSSPKNDP